MGEFGNRDTLLYVFCFGAVNDPKCQAVARDEILFWCKGLSVWEIGIHKHKHTYLLEGLGVNEKIKIGYGYYELTRTIRICHELAARHIRTHVDREINYTIKHFTSYLGDIDVRTGSLCITTSSTRGKGPLFVFSEISKLPCSQAPQKSVLFVENKDTSLFLSETLTFDI